MMLFACVLKSGGRYGPAHVLKLKRRVAEHAPRADFICFSDVDVPGCDVVKLRHDLPGWWSKMEVFSPSCDRPLTYMDLDVVPVGDLTGIADVNGPAMLSDFYHPGFVNSSVMRIPEFAKADIWNAFMADPGRHMREHSREGGAKPPYWGDQAFIARFWKDHAVRLQDARPGEILSWKVDQLATRGVPEGARLLVFHGRPWPEQAGF